MALRIGILWIVTGVALAAMAWFDPFGPLLVLFGAGWCAVVLDHGEDLEPQAAPLIVEQRERQPRAS